MDHASDSCNMVFTGLYMEHLSPGHELEVVVVPMEAYDFVFGLPWFHSSNPDVDMQLAIGAANPICSGRSGSWPARLSGMPWQCTRLHGYREGVF